MMTNNVVAAWPSLATTQFAASAVLLLFVFQVLRFLYRGVCIRIKFRRLRAQGIVSLSVPFLRRDETGRDGTRRDVRDLGS